MFTVEERDRVRARVLELAAADPRVVAAAAVGSLANGGGDRFSDLDLTFGVSGCEPLEVLDDWTHDLADELGAVRLFDVPSGPWLYRVFLFPGALQVDLSCAPATEFGAGGPSWELLFGDATDRSFPSPPSADDLLGRGVHHAIRACLCIERGRLWQAEHWIDELRDHALALACRRLGLTARYARGFDDLPREVLSPLVGARPRSLARAELLRALSAGVEGLLRESAEAAALAARVAPQLRELLSPDLG